MRFDFEFGRRHSRQRTLFIFIAAALLVLAVFTGVEYFQSRSALARAEAAVVTARNLEAQSAIQPVISDQEREQLEVELKLARSTIDQLGVPWSKVFTQINSGGNGDVALLSLEPNANKRELTLVAEARNSDAMFKYVQTFEKSDFLKDVHVVHHVFNTQDPLRPIQFTLVGNW